MNALFDRPVTTGHLLLGCVVSPTTQILLKPLMAELKECNPRATDEQIVDMIFEDGVRHLFVQFNLPRPGSNPDEDG